MGIIVLIGSTGSGKSTLCNVLAGRRHNDHLCPVSEVFADAFDTTSNTIQCDDKVITMVNTPGFDDPSGNDTTNISNMVTVLKALGHIDILLVVINGQTPRLETSNIAMLLVFKAMFGDQFLKNTIFEITRWGYDQRSTKIRGRSKESEEQCLEQLNERLEALKLKPVGSKSVPGVFIDSLYNNSNEHELTMFNNERGKLLAHLEQSISLTCKDFTAVEIDGIKAQVAVVKHVAKLRLYADELERNIVLEKEAALMAVVRAAQEEERRRKEEEARLIAEELARQAAEVARIEEARRRAEEEARDLAEQYRIEEWARAEKAETTDRKATLVELLL